MRIVWAAFIALGLVNTAQGAALWGERIGKWQVIAFSSDQNGAFHHCGASATFEDGNMLLFALTASYGWSMGFANDKWRLTPGSQYGVRYWVDAYEPENATAVAISPKLVEVSLKDSIDLFNNFRTGYRLFVYAQNAKLQFELADTSRVLTYLAECVKAGGQKPAR